MTLGASLAKALASLPTSGHGSLPAHDGRGTQGVLGEVQGRLEGGGNGWSRGAVGYSACEDSPISRRAPQSEMRKGERATAHL
eukprot:scaffold191940_cov40-Tisochrysis_lutea.AAC.1